MYEEKYKRSSAYNAVLAVLTKGGFGTSSGNTEKISRNLVYSPEELSHSAFWLMIFGNNCSRLERTGHNDDGNNVLTSEQFSHQ